MKKIVSAAFAAILTLALSSVFAQQGPLPGGAPTATASTFTLRQDLRSYCVGQTPQYSVTAPVGLAGQFIYWVDKQQPLWSNTAASTPKWSNGLRLQKPLSFFKPYKVFNRHINIVKRKPRRV